MLILFIILYSLRDSVTIAVRREADMLTLFPKIRMLTLAEKILMPMLWFTVTLLLPFYFVQKRGFVKFSIGIGPFMMFRRDAYLKIGGHDSVKNAIVEDVWLARRIKEHKMHLVAADGGEMLSVRMYGSFRDIWNGFSKNIFAGFGFSTPVLFAVNLLYVLLFFLPFLLFFKELSLPFCSGYMLILTGLQVIYSVFLPHNNINKMEAWNNFNNSASNRRFICSFNCTELMAVDNLWQRCQNGRGRTYNPKK